MKNLVFNVFRFVAELVIVAFFVVTSWWLWCAWECANGSSPCPAWVSFNNLIVI